MDMTPLTRVEIDPETVAGAYRTHGPARVPIDSATPDPTLWDPAETAREARAVFAVAVAVIIGGAIGVTLAIWGLQ